MSPAEITPEIPEIVVGPSSFADLRSVRWRINLGVLPSSVDSTIGDLRRVTADSRRRYARLRRRLLVDPHIKFGKDSSDLVSDNPLSQNPDSTWGRFFHYAELEKMVDKDLSRLYPEHGSYFQTLGCQGLLSRILLLWCLQHPECGYRQGMHELLAPLIYVLHADIQHLIKVRKLYEDHFVDKFDEDLLDETLGFSFKLSSKYPEETDGFQEESKKHSSNTNLDANLESIVLLSDPYGPDGELGILLSEKFMEHDVYCMFDALMSGSGGDVVMAEFFSSPVSAMQSGLPPVIEASLALYHLLSIVDASLYTHLIELGVEPQYFALRWLRVLFGREFPLEDLLIIWDEIFSFSNSKSITSKQDSGVSNSPRGAFISAMGVSMMLNVRSSLLATELATSCLQRLLNFPEQVDLDKLIRKAKSLVPLALDANVPSHSDPLSKHHSCVNEMEAKRHTHSLSADLSSPHMPVNTVPERYWEEKWRLLQKEEDAKKGTYIQQAPPKKRGWTEKIKSKLSRVGSDPSFGNRESKDRVKKPVRRSLLTDLSCQLNFEQDIEESRNENLPSIEDPIHNSSDLGLPDSVNEDHSPAFSDPTSPLENDSEKSSITSDVSHDIHDDVTQKSSSFQSTTEEPPIPNSDAVDINACGVSGLNDSSSEMSAVVPKVLKTLSGKFQWLWKFGRHNSSEGTFSDKKIEVENEKSGDGASLQRNKAKPCVIETNCGYVHQKIEVENEKSCHGGSPQSNNAEACASEINCDYVCQKIGFEDGKSCDDASTKKNKVETCFSEINHDHAYPKIEIENGKSGDDESLQKNKAETCISEINRECEYQRFGVESGKSGGGASLDRNKVETCVSVISGDHVNLKIDGCDQNLVCALRNLGQSMLKNIQVIESAFQPERSQAGSEQLSKHFLVEKGQVTAVTALNELRKISNLLQEV